ncbi:MAG: DUF2975 domain-containing protein [Gammaproteobacteria bacterium]|nr:DUF2975 domain-containing protein [Gammaproteobacteria bacterium]
MNKIQRVSVFFRVAFQIAFVALPILLAIAWINAPKPFIAMQGLININFIPKMYEHSVLHVLSRAELFEGFLVSCLPALVQLYILYSLINLFKLYERGNIFSLRHVDYIRNIGYALFIGQLIIAPIHEALIGIVLTIHNPPHHRFFQISLDQSNIGVLLTGLLVILISWIVAEGCKIHEEQQLTI